MAIACYAFDVDAQIHNVFEVLSYLNVELIGSKSIQLGVLNVVLVVYHQADIVREVRGIND